MKKKFFVIICGVMVLALVAVVGTTLGLSRTVGELTVEIGKSPVDSILASAEINDESVVDVPVMYYDQVMDGCIDLYDVNLASVVNQRQFEWSKCGYYKKALETGMTEPELNSDYLPVAVGGEMQPNRGVSGAAFARWFSAVDGKSQAMASSLKLRYDAATASFGYASGNFYPLNKVAVPGESVNSDGNNHLFTMNLGVPVQVIADGNETFSVTADDDTWVYVGDRLVLDMGGIHEAITGRFKVMNGGEIYTAVGEEDLAYSGVKVDGNTGTIVRIFHADRDSTESVFRVNFSNMLLNVTKTTLAKSDGGESDSLGDGATVAYNPEDPGYAAPLGESLVYHPNRSRAILASAITQSVVLGVLGVVLVAATSAAWRYWRRGRNQAE